MANSVAGKPSLGGRLRELREWRGYTQRGLAAAVGISEGELSRIENGMRRSPGAEVLFAICSELKCDMRYVLRGIGKPWMPGHVPAERAPSRDGRRRENRGPIATTNAHESGEHEMPTVSHRDVRRLAASSSPPRSGK